MGEGPPQRHGWFAHAHDDFVGARGECQDLPREIACNSLQEVPRRGLLHHPARGCVDRRVIYGVAEIVRDACGPEAARKLNIHLEGLSKGALLPEGGRGTLARDRACALVCCVSEMVVVCVVVVAVGRQEGKAQPRCSAVCQPVRGRERRAGSGWVGAAGGGGRVRTSGRTPWCAKNSMPRRATVSHAFPFSPPAPAAAAAAAAVELERGRARPAAEWNSAWGA